MRVLIAAFCDSARAQGDRLDMLGAGARIFFTRSTPVQLKTWLATLVSTDETEIGTKQAATLRVFDADLLQMGEVEIFMTTVKADRPGLGAQTAKATPITLNIPRPGIYLIRVVVDDKIISEWPFEVALNAEEAPPFQKAKD
jgi:uncharacterized protein DUF6941